MKKGTKVAIRNVQVVNSLLLLNDTNTLVLGLSHVCQTHTSIQRKDKTTEI